MLSEVDEVVKLRVLCEWACEVAHGVKHVCKELGEGRNVVYGSLFLARSQILLILFLAVLEEISERAHFASVDHHISSEVSSPVPIVKDHDVDVDGGAVNHVVYENIVSHLLDFKPLSCMHGCFSDEHLNEKMNDVLSIASKVQKDSNNDCVPKPGFRSFEELKNVTDGKTKHTAQ